MNKKAQDPITLGIAAFIGIILLLVLIPIISNAFSSITCKDEKNQIENLRFQLAACQGSNEEVLNLLRNCQEELNNTKIECDKKIENITNYYESNFENNPLVIHFEKRIKTLMFIFLIPLFLSLISFEIKLKGRWAKFLLVLRISFWAVYLLVLIVVYHGFFIDFFLP